LEKQDIRLKCLCRLQKKRLFYITVNFSYIHILQGSVAKQLQLRRGGYLIILFFDNAPRTGYERCSRNMGCWI